MLLIQKLLLMRISMSVSSQMGKCQIAKKCSIYIMVFIYRLVRMEIHWEVKPLISQVHLVLTVQLTRMQRIFLLKFQTFHLKLWKYVQQLRRIHKQQHLKLYVHLFQVCVFVMYPSKQSLGGYIEITLTVWLSVFLYGCLSVDTTLSLL